MKYLRAKMNDKPKHDAAWYQAYDFRLNPERLSGAVRRHLVRYAYSAGWTAEKPVGKVARGKLSNPTALKEATA
jgi:hypothetical protein